MPELYVVKRPFRSKGQFFATGDFIEDLLDEVKYGKIKLTEGKIARVPEEGPERDGLIAWFKQRKGFDLAQALQDRASEGSKIAESKEPSAKATPQPGTTAAPAPAKHPMPKPVTKAAPSASAPVAKSQTTAQPPKK